MPGDAQVVIGLGNRMRGDDAAGLEVVRLLRERGAELPAIAHERETSGLVELWSEAAEAIVVDAVSGERPGRLHRFDAAARPLPATLETSASTHAIGLGETIELARELGRLPPRLRVLGIEGTRFGLGEEPSPEVLEAASLLADELASGRGR